MEKIISIFNRENILVQDLKTFSHRRAVRGVVFDTEDNVALLHVAAKDYYVLPGGGVDEGESSEKGVIREVKEETGCNTEIIANIGSILEYEKNNKLIKKSKGYMCRVIGDKCLRILVGDEDEDEKGSVVVWTSIQKAIELMKSTPYCDNLYSQYCVERDLAFLEEAKNF